MNNAAFTVILPHKRNPGNDAALRIALDMLMDSTVNDFILLMAADSGQPLYPLVNALFEQATTDCCVYWSSDMFPAYGWDVPMLEAWNAHTLITNVLVEPGAIGIHHMNYHKDFGRKAETFQRGAFEAWATSSEAPMLEGEGWFAPYMISRYQFLAFGGLDDTGMVGDAHGFTGADEALFARWKADGNTIKRVKSYAYHLQRYSQVDEQTKEGRR